MNFSIAVIVCLGYFLSPVWSLDEDQLKVMIRLYEDLKVPDNKNAEHEITKVLIESFRIEQPTRFFKYDSSKTYYVNLHILLKKLAKRDNECFDKFKVEKLSPFEVKHYLNEFSEHPKFEEQLGYLTLQQLSGVLRNLNLYISSKVKLEEYKSEIGDDNEINAAEFLMIVLEITPKGDGLTLAQIKKFVHLYEVRETVCGNINSSAIQEVFKDLDITSRQNDLNLLLNSNRPFAKVLMNLIIIAAECSQTVEENEFRLFSPGEIVLCIEDFNIFDKLLDGLLCKNEYVPYVVELKTVLNQMEGHVKDTLTFERAQEFSKQFDGPQGIEGKKVINFAEFLEIQLVHKQIPIEEEDSITDRVESA